MRRSIAILVWAAMSGSAAAAASLSAACAGAQEAQAPPPVPREFRGVWVATVGNMDWPSSPDLSTWDQQRELLAILDRAQALGLNAVILQVRPAADALYPSPYEPWSRVLTGRQGRAPEPPWDPLAFAVEQAHRRGLELHAWFNPYRAAALGDSVPARTHVRFTNPALVHRYGSQTWMDPGSAEVQRRSLRAIVDVVKRYDVDGVHIDDYFYPYPETNRSGRTLEFPDAATYARYKKAGGTLSRDDWRRDNVNRFVETLYRSVHEAKPWVRVGISPFGIWRPGSPPQVKGFDAYAKIYADSREWLRRGWADYFVPQLYWPIDARDQSYPVLLDWWRSENTKERHLWPGLAAFRVTDSGPSHLSAREIGAEIDSTRARGKADGGHVLFNMTALLQDPDSLDELLVARYAGRALVPASPWLGAAAPSRPAVALRRSAATGESILSMAPGADSVTVWLWTVRAEVNGAWSTEILPGWLRSHRIATDNGARVSRVYVTAVSRTGIESPAAVARPDGAARRE